VSFIPNPARRHTRGHRGKQHVAAVVEASSIVGQVTEDLHVSKIRGAEKDRQRKKLVVQKHFELRGFHGHTFDNLKGAQRLQAMKKVAHKKRVATGVEGQSKARDRIFGAYKPHAPGAVKGPSAKQAAAAPVITTPLMVKKAALKFKKDGTVPSVSLADVIKFGSGLTKPIHVKLIRALRDRDLELQKSGLEINPGPSTTELEVIPPQKQTEPFLSPKARSEVDSMFGNGKPIFCRRAGEKLLRSSTYKTFPDHNRHCQECRKLLAVLDSDHFIHASEVLVPDCPKGGKVEDSSHPIPVPPPLPPSPPPAPPSSPRPASASSQSELSFKPVSPKHKLDQQRKKEDESDDSSSSEDDSSDESSPGLIKGIRNFLFPKPPDSGVATPQKFVLDGDSPPECVVTRAVLTATGTSLDKISSVHEERLTATYKGEERIVVDRGVQATKQDFYFHRITVEYAIGTKPMARWPFYLFILFSWFVFVASMALDVHIMMKAHSFSREVMKIDPFYPRFPFPMYYPWSLYGLLFAIGSSIIVPIITCCCLPMEDELKELFIEYLPHALTCVMTTFDRDVSLVAAKASLTQRFNRSSAFLPIPDRYRYSVQRGTELLALSWIQEDPQAFLCKRAVL